MKSTLQAMYKNVTPYTLYVGGGNSAVQMKTVPSASSLMVKSSKNFSLSTIVSNLWFSTKCKEKRYQLTKREFLNPNRFSIEKLENFANVLFVWKNN
jgi:hypothetical protein